MNTKIYTVQIRRSHTHDRLGYLKSNTVEFRDEREFMRYEDAFRLKEKFNVENVENDNAPYPGAYATIMTN